MPVQGREKLVERLEAGDLTLARAVLMKGARVVPVEVLVRACRERKNRQTPSILRKASVAPWLEVRHMSKAQFARIESVLADEDPWENQGRLAFDDPLRDPINP